MKNVIKTVANRESPQYPKQSALSEPLQNANYTIEATEDRSSVTTGSSVPFARKGWVRAIPKSFARKKFPKDCKEAQSQTRAKQKSKGLSI